MSGVKCVVVAENVGVVGMWRWNVNEVQPTLVWEHPHICVGVKGVVVAENVDLSTQRK